MARLNLKYTVISCYVPTEDAKEAREWKTAKKKHRALEKEVKTMAKRENKE